MNWKTKLSSRKLWLAIIGFVSALLMAYGAEPDTVEKVTSVIMAGGVLISYILAEGWIDASRESGDTVIEVGEPVDLGGEFDGRE